MRLSAWPPGTASAERLRGQQWWRMRQQICPRCHSPMHVLGTPGETCAATRLRTSSRIPKGETHATQTAPVAGHVQHRGTHCHVCVNARDYDIGVQRYDLHALDGFDVLGCCSLCCHLRTVLLRSGAECPIRLDAHAAAPARRPYLLDLLPFRGCVLHSNGLACRREGAHGIHRSCSADLFHLPCTMSKGNVTVPETLCCVSWHIPRSPHADVPASSMFAGCGMRS